MDTIKLSQDGKVILPQPNEIPEKEKQDAMGAYLMMFAGIAAGLPFPFLSLIASIIYFFINKKTRFVAFHSLQSLITQLPISIFNGFVVVWGIRLIFVYAQENSYKYLHYYGIFVLFVILWNIIYIIYSLIACTYAYKGRFFYMILFGRIAYSVYYGKKAIEKDKKGATTDINSPPA